MARGNTGIGTSRMAVAAAIDQKPPRLIPRMTRAASSIGRLTAAAVIRLDTLSSISSPSITSRRSHRLVTTGTSRAAIAPTTAVAVTACPAAPRLTPRSLAKGVSTLGGRNSAATRPKTLSDSAATPPQAGRAGSAASWLAPAGRSDWTSSMGVSGWRPEVGGGHRRLNVSLSGRTDRSSGRASDAGLLPPGANGAGERTRTSTPCGAGT